MILLIRLSNYLVRRQKRIEHKKLYSFINSTKLYKCFRYYYCYFTSNKRIYKKSFVLRWQTKLCYQTLSDIKDLLALQDKKCFLSVVHIRNYRFDGMHTIFEHHHLNYYWFCQLVVASSLLRLPYCVCQFFIAFVSFTAFSSFTAFASSFLRLPVLLLRLSVLLRLPVLYCVCLPVLYCVCHIYCVYQFFIAFATFTAFTSSLLRLSVLLRLSILYCVCQFYCIQSLSIIIKTITGFASW